MLNLLLRLIPKSVKRRVKQVIDSTVEEKLSSALTIAPTVLVNQLVSILQYEQHVPPPPPKHLQVRVVGVYAGDFIQGGFDACRDLNFALEPAGKSLADFETILDFGCGCGRTVRALHTVSPRSTLYGVDIDDEAISWVRENYAPFGTFSTVPHVPPTRFPDHQFDFIYGISVFTHLPEHLQTAWLEELRRISKPKGYLVLTTHGEKHYKKLDRQAVNVMKEKGFFYSDFGFNYGRSIGLPDFYQTAFHSHDYIRREWAKYFDIVDIKALGMSQHQDTVLLRNR